MRLHDWGLSWEADSRHRQMIMEYFGLNEESKALNRSGNKEEVTAEGDREAQSRRAKELQSSGREDQLPRSGQPARAVLGEGGLQEDVERCRTRPRENSKGLRSLPSSWSA